MLEEDKVGKKPLYRDRNWNAEERIQAKKNKQSNWYKNGETSKIKYKSLMFVPPTPGSVLLKDLTKREQELNGENKNRIKFVEKGGVKIKDILVKKNPFP